MPQPRVLIQSGHSAAYPPFRPNGGGAPGEAAWATDLAARIRDRLVARGVDVTLVGSWLIYVNGVATVVAAPPEATRDYDLAFCIHYEATGHNPNSGCFIARAAGDPVGAVADRFIAIWKAAYPAATGIKLHQEWVTVNMTDYYAFRATSASTPGVIAEHGIGQGLDHGVLFDQIDKVADTDAKCICDFLGVKWDQQPAPAPISPPEPGQPAADPCADVREALRLANLQKREMEMYIRDDPAGHRASVDDDAASKGIAPIDDMLQWAQDHFNAGDIAP